MDQIQSGGYLNNTQTYVSAYMYLSSTRQTHPWVDTNLRRLMRQKSVPTEKRRNREKKKTLKKVQIFKEECIENFQAI